MKKTAIMLALTLMAASAFCMLAPNASAAHISGTYTNVQLPDIYRLEVPVNYDDSLSFWVGSADYRDYARYPNSCFYYNDETRFIDAFRDAANGMPSSIPWSDSWAYGSVVYLYVLAYDAPHKLKVSSSYTSYSHVLSAEDLWEESDSIGWFRMYSGQQVKLTMHSSGSGLYFHTGNLYGEPELKQGVTNITIRETGEHRLYASGGYTMAFATFSIEYDEPPSAGAFGVLFLIVAVVCMGLMVYFARPQKIK
jgi:hypothetical protein